MNRGELRDRIHFSLNEDLTDPIFFTVAQVNEVIQEAMEIITEEITDLRKEAFITMEPGRFLYTLGEVAPDVMTIFRVWSENDEDKLDVVTMRELDNSRERWMEVTSDRPDWWFPVSHDCFGIYPGPSAGGGILRVDYIAWPETLEDDFDSPILRETDQDLVIMYGQYDGLIRQWETDRGFDIFSTFSAAFRDQKFKNEVRRFQHMITNRGSEGFNLPRLD